MLRTARDRLRPAMIELECARRGALAMLGELPPHEFRDVSVWFDALTKSQVLRLQAEAARIISETEKFCRRNFEDSSPARLSAAFRGLLRANGNTRLPLPDFERDCGRLRSKVRGEIPVHATVHFSARPGFGLKFEFPERKFADDCIVAFRELRAATDASTKLPHRDLPAIEAGHAADRPPTSGHFSYVDASARHEADVLERRGAFARFTMHSCYSMVEAWINGVGWECLRSREGTALRKYDRDALTGRNDLLTRLIRVSELVTGAAPPMSAESPLFIAFKDFLEDRHASTHVFDPKSPTPFDRLHRIYDLDLARVRTHLLTCSAVVGVLHAHVRSGANPPSWLPLWDNDLGVFVNGSPRLDRG